MAASARRGALLVVGLLVLLAVLSTPVAAHEGHAAHETQQDEDRSIWPLFVLFGTVSAGGTLLASQRLDVPREVVVGLSTGGIAVAVGAAIVWLA